MVRAITYTDYLSALSGSIHLEFEDDALRWQNSWFPTIGDPVSLMLGYCGAPMLDCGAFQVDDLSLTGPPDIFHLRCLSAYVTPAMRTRLSAAYESLTLLDIATIVAGRYGLTVVSAPGVEVIQFARVTQNRETDLDFLHRLAADYGYEFTVRGGMLVFYAMSTLEAMVPVATIERSNIDRIQCRSRSHGIYSAAEAAYFDPYTKTLIAQTASPSAPVPETDTLKLDARCESASQASLRAQAALHRSNMKAIKMRLSGPGNVALAAGVTIELAGWGVFDAVYLIEMARHRITRAIGYSTEIEARQVS